MSKFHLHAGNEILKTFAYRPLSMGLIRGMIKQMLPCDHIRILTNLQSLPALYPVLDNRFVPTRDAVINVREENVAGQLPPVVFLAMYISASDDWIPVFRSWTQEQGYIDLHVWSSRKVPMHKTGIQRIELLAYRIEQD